jgi:hypothetical protein
MPTVFCVKNGERGKLRRFAAQRPLTSPAAAGLVLLDPHHPA